MTSKIVPVPELLCDKQTLTEQQVADIYEMGFRDGYHIGYGNALRNVEAVTDPVDTDAPMPLDSVMFVRRLSSGTVESV